MTAASPRCDLPADPAAPDPLKPSPARIRGEWFEQTPSVLSLAASLGGDVGIEVFPA